MDSYRRDANPTDARLLYGQPPPPPPPPPLPPPPPYAQQQFTQSPPPYAQQYAQPPPYAQQQQLAQWQTHMASRKRAQESQLHESVRRGADLQTLRERLNQSAPMKLRVREKRITELEEHVGAWRTDAAVVDLEEVRHFLRSKRFANADTLPDTEVRDYFRQFALWEEESLGLRDPYSKEQVNQYIALVADGQNMEANRARLNSEVGDCLTFLERREQVEKHKHDCEVWEQRVASLPIRVLKDMAIERKVEPEGLEKAELTASICELYGARRIKDETFGLSWCYNVRRAESHYTCDLIPRLDVKKWRPSNRVATQINKLVSDAYSTNDRIVDWNLHDVLLPTTDTDKFDYLVLLHRGTDLIGFCSVQHQDNLTAWLCENFAACPANQGYGKEAVRLMYTLLPHEHEERPSICFWVGRKNRDWLKLFDDLVLPHGPLRKQVVSGHSRSSAGDKEELMLYR